ncbi:MAG: hypothetical protein UE295_11925 [Acutalibacteraceae bacterium]|nr:hypothetical protein [Acutalibacteraceae bacterium]
MNKQEKSTERIDGSINFPTTPDTYVDFPAPESIYDVAERIKQILEPIEQSVANMTKDVYPSMAKMLEEFQNSLLETVTPTIQQFNQSYKLYDWSALTNSIFSSLNLKLEHYDWSYLVQQLTPVLDSVKNSSQSISIEFNEDDLETIKQLKIPIEKYATQSDNKTTSWIMTIERVVAFIASLITIICFIEEKIEDAQIHNETSSLQQQNESIPDSDKIVNLLEKIYNEMIE